MTLIGKKQLRFGTKIVMITITIVAIVIGTHIHTHVCSCTHTHPHAYTTYHCTHTHAYTMLSNGHHMHGSTDVVVEMLKPILWKYKVAAYLSAHDHIIIKSK